MACERRVIDSTFSDDATFRTWGSSVSDLLTDNGLTKTADTGQIDWSTVARPSTSAYAGYEVYTLTTDTNHGSFPLYIKLEYGCGSATTRPALRMQTATATNGAGTLSGQLSTQYVASSNAAGGTNLPYYVSAGDGYFILATSWTPGAAGAGFFNSILHIERLRDNTGAATDDGLYVFREGNLGSTTNQCNAQIVNPSGSAFSLPNNRIGAVMLSQSGAVDSDVYMATHHPVSRQILNPLLGNLFYYSSDITDDSEFSVDMYSNATNYKAIGQVRQASGGTCLIGNFGFAPGYAIVWE